MPSFNLSLPVEVPSEDLWALISDVPRFAGLFPYITTDDLEIPEPGRWLFRRQINLPNISSLVWREENYLAGNNELAFRALEGDLRIFTGRWQVIGDNGGATLDLALDYEIPDAFAGQAPDFMVRFMMDELFKSICRRVKEAAEGELP